MKMEKAHYLLNVSCLDLRLLTKVLSMSPDCDEVGRARSIVQSNRAALREALARSGLAGCLPETAPERDSAVSVEWLHVGPERDRVLHRCRAAGLEVLPGQPFFWSATGDEKSQDAEWIRVALLRDVHDFQRGTDIFLAAMRECA
ncbi:hypothetical protein ACWC2T_35990 [Streptomyces sp. NPDC001393]